MTAVGVRLVPQRAGGRGRPRGCSRSASCSRALYFGGLRPHAARLSRAGGSERPPQRRLVAAATCSPIARAAAVAAVRRPRATATARLPAVGAHASSDDDDARARSSTCSRSPIGVALVGCVVLVILLAPLARRHAAAAARDGAGAVVGRRAARRCSPARSARARSAARRRRRRARPRSALIVFALVPVRRSCSACCARASSRAGAVSELLHADRRRRPAPATCATCWPTRSATARCSSPTGSTTAPLGRRRRPRRRAAGRGRPARAPGRRVEREGRRGRRDRPRPRAVRGPGARRARSPPPPASRSRTSACRPQLRARVEELRASRARIVEAGTAERRRLERNLHDGAQQRLVALSLTLRARPEPAAQGPRRRRATDGRRPGGAARSRSRSCASWPAASTRPCCPTAGSARALEALAGRSPMPVELAEVPGRAAAARRSRRPPTSWSPRR